MDKKIGPNSTPLVTPDNSTHPNPQLQTESKKGKGPVTPHSTNTHIPTGPQEDAGIPLQQRTVQTHQHTSLFRSEDFEVFDQALAECTLNIQQLHAEQQRLSARSAKTEHQLHQHAQTLSAHEQELTSLADEPQQEKPGFFKRMLQRLSTTLKGIRGTAEVHQQTGEQLNALDQTTKKQSKEIQRLHKMLESLSKKSAKQKQRLTAKNEQLTNLGKKLREAREQHQKLVESNNALVETHQKQAETIESQELLIQSLKEALSQASASHSQELDELRKVNSELSQSRTELYKELENEINAAGDLRDQLLDQEVQLQQLRAQLTQQADAHQKERSHQQGLMQQKVSLPESEALATKQAEIEALHQQVQQLAQQLAQSKPAELRQDAPFASGASPSQEAASAQNAETPPEPTEDVEKPSQKKLKQELASVQKQLQIIQKRFAEISALNKRMAEELKIKIYGKH